MMSHETRDNLRRVHIEGCRDRAWPEGVRVPFRLPWPLPVLLGALAVGAVLATGIIMKACAG